LADSDDMIRLQLSGTAACNKTEWRQCKRGMRLMSGSVDQWTGWLVWWCCWCW